MSPVTLSLLTRWILKEILLLCLPAWWPHFTQAPALNLELPAQLLLVQIVQLHLILQKDRPWLCSWHLYHCKLRLGEEPPSPSRCREPQGQDNFKTSGKVTFFTAAGARTYSC